MNERAIMAACCSASRSVLLAGALLCASLGRAGAQSVRVSGVVMPEGHLSPIRGATVRLGDLPSARTNDAGHFQFDKVAAGAYVLRVQAVGYRSTTIEITVARDTTLQIALEPVAAQLDTVVVSAGTITIRGKIRDSATHTPLYDAEVHLSPGARTVGAITGGFRISDVPRGEVTLAFTAIEHMPREITFVADRDTSLVIDLGIDSVGVRMLGVQSKRLETRTRAFPGMARSLDRTAMAQTGAPTIGIMLHRLVPRTFHESPPWPDYPCLFLDDEKVRFDFLMGLAPDLIERIEILGTHAEMVRIYSTRYVSSLMREPSLARIVYIRTGLGIVCA